ncbi:MAG: hypothetical protein M1383_04970 [Patescibacteria group bacterium]|nr:hypothetical protein [Patescibacteria group bacterium]
MRNNKNEFREIPNGNEFSEGDIITCLNDGSGGAEWKVYKKDKNGNVYAVLIDGKSASKYYLQKDKLEISPPALGGWMVVQKSKSA